MLVRVDCTQSTIHLKQGQRLLVGAFKTLFPLCIGYLQIDLLGGRILRTSRQVICFHSITEECTCCSKGTGDVAQCVQICEHSKGRQIVH